MIVTIDSGNSFLKAGLFSADGRLLEAKAFQHPALESITPWLEDTRVKTVIVSDVKGNIKIDENAFPHLKTHRINENTRLPFISEYKTPETLGNDRKAGIAGARMIFPEENILVIDAGTCITYDIIESNGVYKGGAIAPGMQMRFLALHQQTGKLPLVSGAGEIEDPGLSTTACIHAGVVKGMVHEINGFIEQYSQSFDRLRVVLSGGDASYFEKNLKREIFAVPQLVLTGLYYIATYNDK